jgi:hypothetical protein
MVTVPATNEHTDVLAASTVNDTVNPVPVVVADTGKVLW